MKDSEHFSSGVVSSSQFNTTHWSVVLLAGNTRDPKSSVALERLCRTYWFPLYAFARRKGWNEEDAKDLTQQFFARLLEKNDFETVDPRKGKFRTFLLTSFSHFLSNEIDRARAAKRGGGQRIFSLDELQAEQPDSVAIAGDLPADAIYDLRWALTIMENALANLRQEWSALNKSGQFEQLKKFLTDEPLQGEYAELAAELGMTTPALAVTVHRMRNRYRDLVRGEVAQTVRSPLELEEEMRHLCAVLRAA